MTPLTIFILKRCPYCKKAIKMIDQLQEDEKYSNIEIVYIDEAKEKKHAASYDYFYVPSFYIGKTKLYEGAIKEDQLIDVLNQYLTFQEKDV